MHISLFFSIIFNIFFAKKKANCLFSLYIPIQVPTPFPPLIPSTHPPTPIQSSEDKAHCFEEGPRPSLLYLGWARYSSKENGFQKAGTCSRDKSWCHCQRHHSLPQPYNCHPHSKGLLWSYADLSLSSQSWWAPVSSGKLFQLVSPSWSWALCPYFPASHSSIGLWELNLVFCCGSLPLLPSAAGWRFYGDI